MHLKKIFWNGISRDERYTAINDTVSVINKYGTIANFLRFSDLSLGLSIEIEENAVGRLYSDLRQKINISEALEDIDASSKAIWLVMLNLTFLQGTGDLEIENPGLIE